MKPKKEATAEQTTETAQPQADADAAQEDRRDPRRQQVLRRAGAVLQARPASGQADGAAMKYQTNQKVTTPLGVGVVQAPFAVLAANGEHVVSGFAVRLPVNDETRPHLNKSNCLTPHAEATGLWVFQESELK